MKALVLVIMLASLACYMVPAETKTPRSAAAISEFKRHNPCPANGLRRGACPGYVIDHVVPLACGGEDSSGNMQWQTAKEARQKDRWERHGCPKAHRMARIHEK